MFQNFYSFIICLLYKIFSINSQQIIEKKLKGLHSRYLQNAFNSCGGKTCFGWNCHLREPQKIEIGEGCYIADDTYLTAWSMESLVSEGNSKTSVLISIGNYCSIGAHNHITASSQIIIGDGFLSGKWVTITDNSHGKYDLSSQSDIKEWFHLSPRQRSIYSKGSVIIGKNVWVGDKVTILPGVVIGDGVVIGANSVVTKNIPSYSIVGGNPAKVLKQLPNISLIKENVKK